MIDQARASCATPVTRCTLSVLILVLTPLTGAQEIIDTVAGNYAIDGQPATAVGIGNPLGLTLDASGNLYVTVSEGNQVFRIDPAGNIFVVAGNGSRIYLSDGAQATDNGLSAWDVVLDAAGNLYISDLLNSRIRKVDSSGTMTTVTGVWNPRGMAIDAAGNIYIAAANIDHSILKLDPSGTLTPVAGNGTEGYSGDGGPATAASLDHPSGVEVDAAGNLYISDTHNHRIRKVDTSGVITTIVGDGTAGFAGDGGPAISARLHQPFGLHLDSAGNLLIADQVNQRIRKVDTSGTITSIAGGGSGSGPPGDGGPATSAKLSFPYDVLTDGSGNIFIADGRNNRVRKVDASGTITTIGGNGFNRLFGDGGPAPDAGLAHPTGVAVDGSGNFYIADRHNSRIRKVDASGIITSVASAPNSSPYHLDVDSAGNIYFTESYAGYVQKVDPTGAVTIVAGTGRPPGFSGDGGPATSATLNTPTGVTVDATGNVYVTDWGNQRIRKVDPSGVITTVAGNGTPGFSGDGGPAIAASINRPEGLAVDAAGNLYICDLNNGRVRKVDASGTISTVAGDGSTCYSCGDGGPATAAGLFRPQDIAFDAAGNFYVGDSGVHLVRKVDTAGIISTIAGNQIDGYSGDGGPAISARVRPWGIDVDATGNLYIAHRFANRVRRVSLTTKPTAVAGPDQSIHAGDTVFLDGGDSFDDDTATVDLIFAWTLTVTPSGSTTSLVGDMTATPSFVADLPGSYEARLIVTDGAGLASDPDDVVISSTNLAPTAAAGADFVGVVGATAVLDGSGSSDPEDDPLTYAWSLESEPIGSTAALSDAGTVMPSFLPDLAGDYVVRLLVHDGFEDSLPDDVTVTVITGEEFAENETMEATEIVSALPPADVTTSGNQEAFTNYTGQAIRAIQQGDLERARNKLADAIARTDGCSLRGTPDGNGPGRDWITDCATQIAVYGSLTAALDAISE